MSSKCGLFIIVSIVSIILLFIVNGYAKDISGVERGSKKLNEYISHYETLSYDTEQLHASHRRAKRSVTKDHNVNLKFNAHGKYFHLRLKRDLSTFSDKLEVHSTHGPISVDTSHIYHGEVVNDKDSYVFGSILNGVFEGKIITERDAYYIENAKHYFPNETYKNDGFHSVIYNEKHLEDPYKDVREGHVGGCGITEEVSQWMENIQNSAVEDVEPEELPKPMSSDKIILNNPSSSSSDKQQKQKDKHKISLRKQQQQQHHHHHGNGDDSATATTTDKAIDSSISSSSSQSSSSSSSSDSSNSDSSNTSSSSSSSSTTTHPHLLHFKSSNISVDALISSSSSPSPSIPTTESSSSSSPPSRSNSNQEDDFLYPYEKYSREANYRDNIATTASTSTAEALLSSAKTANTSSSISNAANNANKRKPDDDWHTRSHERVRRAATTRSREDNRNTCSLYIQTDPLIWRHIREGIVDHDRNGRKSDVDEKTREEILSLIAHHVTAVNYIYRNTKFDGRIEHRNIRFEVQRIKIDDDSACKASYNGPHNSFCNEHMDVSNFLNLHSLEDHGDFCLAYVFTYRDFTGGTLGLAWVASASGASGGICEKYKTYTETVAGQYQSTKRSLNTGIITFVNYNSRVPPKVSQLTLAHEIGHNFGSPHDYPQECRPGGANGNYIMFASATSGDRPNNSKFSQCSIRNISNVLDVLVGNTKRDCFKASEGAFCGNKIVESGEECDCGFNEDECKDRCCYPRLISEYDVSLNATAKGCTRRAKTQCSPSQGPCCLSESCTFVPAHYHRRCKEESDCSWSSICNGTTPECPEPKPRDDKTRCNNGTQLCIKGECSGSICLLWNMTECFLTSQIVPHIDKRKLCELACQNGNDTNTCRSTSEFAIQFNLPEGGISLRPGSPCDNFQGYCDVFLKCRAIDAEGPLVRLKNLLLNKETLQTVAQWVTENWYSVVLMGIGFIIVMGIFIKCCAVHTPSSNPKKRPARRISDTLRRPMNTLRRMRNHPQRGAGPRSIPPPAHERSRNPADWDRRHPDRGGGGGGGGGGRSGSRGGAGGGSGDDRRNHHSGRPSSSSRSGPQHGRRATSKL